MGKKTLTFTDEHGVLVVGINAYFNGETGQELLSHAENRLQQGLRSFVLDFAGCECVNSPGVAVLFDLAFKVKEEFGGKIVACEASQLVLDVFEAVNLSTILPLFKSRSEALENAG